MASPERLRCADDEFLSLRSGSQKCARAAIAAAPPSIRTLPRSFWKMGGATLANPLSSNFLPLKIVQWEVVFCHIFSQQLLPAKWSVVCYDFVSGKDQRNGENVLVCEKLPVQLKESQLKLKASARGKIHQIPGICSSSFWAFLFK